MAHDSVDASMKRREFLPILVSVLSAPKLLLSQQAKQPLPAAAPVPRFTGLNPRTPLPVTENAAEIAATELKFFSPVQMQTLARLSRALMPSIGGKPGAIEAEVPQFLDFLLAESEPDRQKLYAGGMDWLEAEAQRKYKVSFSALNEEQVGGLVQPWMRAWMEDHPPVEGQASFLNIAHDEIRMATINSRAWSQMPATAAGEWGRSDLYWSPIEPDMAFAHGEPHVAAQRGAKEMPEYKR